MIVGLQVAGRVRELDRHEALAGGVLEVLERALVAGVVGDNQEEALRRLDDLAELLDRQQAAVVGERVDEDGGVLARLDDLVEVADGAGLHRAGQGAVDPAGGVALQEVAADEVGGGEVLVAGYGDEGRAGLLGAGAVAVSVAHDADGAAELVGHVLDEAGLAAAGRALEQDGDLLGVGRLEELDLVLYGLVEGLGGDDVFFDGVLAVGGFSGHR